MAAAGLKEFESFVGKFVNLWQSGREATLQVNSQAGEATVSLKVKLGQALPLHDHHQQQHQRQHGPSRLRRKQRRADARKSAEEAAREENNPTEEVDATPNVDAAEETIATHNKVTENVTENTANDDLEDSLVEGIVNIPQLDGEPAQGLKENDGTEAFECGQCKLLFIPMSHMYGNPIYKYESCRRHLGVDKCKNCAMPIIGLDKMKAHMERCHEPA